MGSWEWDIPADEIRWSDELYRIYGLDDLTTATYEIFLARVHPDDRPRVDATVRACLETGVPFDFEERIVRPDGEVREVRSRGELVRDPATGRPLRMIGACQDVTEARRTERAFSLVQLTMRAVGEAADLATALAHVVRHVCEATGWMLGQAWLPTPEGDALECGPGWHASLDGLAAFRGLCEGVAFTAGEGLPGRVFATGRPEWAATIDPALFPRAAHLREAALLSAMAVPVLAGDDVVAVLEFFTRTPRAEDGHLVDLVSAVAAQLGPLVRRKRAEDENERSRQELRALSAHLERVREDERAAVARELHDELGQSLTALKMDVAWLERRLPAESAGLRAKLGEMNAILDRTLGQTRRLCSDLRPEVLDGLGLAAALEWQAAEFTRRTGIPCAVRAQPGADQPLDPALSLTLFRVAQEGLTNVARHAEARHVHVDLRERDGHVVLTVADDGRGIERGAVLSSGSLGLLGMRERARLVEGVVRITGEPGKGTTLTVTAPRRAAGALP